MLSQRREESCLLDADSYFLSTKGAAGEPLPGLLLSRLCSRDQREAEDLRGILCRLARALAQKPTTITKSEMAQHGHGTALHDLSPKSVYFLSSNAV